MRIEIKQSRNLASLIACLTKAGGRPFFVGGCVRDALLGRDVHDFDVEVFGVTFEQVWTSAHLAGFKVDHVGKSFGVLKITVGGETFDVSFPRTETVDGSGHRGFEITVYPDLPIEIALARRDFTINAIAVDAVTNEVVDPFNGVQDIAARVLRATSPAFAEDPLRVLRGAQFASRFGFRMNAVTIDLCRSLRNEADTLSVERVWEELVKLFLGSNIFNGIRMLNQCRWLSVEGLVALLFVRPTVFDWLPSAFEGCPGLSEEDRLCVSLAVGFESAHSQRLLGFLTHWRAPKAVTRKTMRLHEVLKTERIVKGAAGVRMLARRLAPVTVEVFSVTLEAVWGGGAALRLLAASESVLRGPEARFVTGETLIGLGLAPGPQFGELLARCEREQDLGVIRSEAEGVLLLRRLVSWADG